MSDFINDWWWALALIAAICLLDIGRVYGRDGQVHVIDGDTIRMAGKTYRLHGIDAPELTQTCPNGWLAGAYAAAFLRQTIDGRKITCEYATTDRYGRTVALCRADGWDLGAWMVRQGMAHAYTKYSRAYEWHEEAAKGLQIGIHGARCKPAWEYRQEQKSRGHKH